MFQLVLTLVHPGFLSHMQSRWDSKTRSFHVGNRQLCPTVEEFRAILMISDGVMLRLKPHTNSISFKNVLHEEFGFTKTSVESILKNGKMDLQRWNDLLTSDGNLSRDRGTTIMTVTMLLAHFFLAPLDDKPSVKVLDVAYTLQQGYMDISGLILAETIMGLNEFAGISTVPKRGSPIVLYIWLLDKFMCLPSYSLENNIDVRAQLIRLECAKPVCMISDDAPINDVMPWYKISKMIYCMDTRPIVILFGMERSTCYFTNNLFRQFGRDKMPIVLGEDTSIDLPITYKMYISFPDQWNGALRLEVQKPRVDYLERILQEASNKRRVTFGDSRVATKRPRRKG